MFRVLSCLTIEHNWGLVGVAALVCFLSAFVAVSLLQRNTHGRVRAGWIVLAAAATGCGIWSTHFIAMLAYQPGVAIAFDIVLTGASLLVAIVIAGGGLAVTTYFPSWYGAAAGGTTIGVGVACMHYLGMWALQYPGRATWSLDLVAGSILFGIVFGICALIIAARRDNWISALGAACLLTLAIVSHHFTAMGAIEIIPDPTQAFDGLSMSPGWLSVVVATGSIGILGVSFSGAFAHRRFNEKSSRLEAALDNLSVGILIFDADERLLVCNRPYMQMYQVPPEVVRPGHTTLSGLLQYRTGNGTFRENPEQYLINLRAALADGSSTHREPKLPDGRILSVSTHPMVGGGWVAVHENITERRQSERERASLNERNQRGIWIEETIGSFRERVETMLQTVTKSASMMRTTAADLLAASARTSDRAKAAVTSSTETSAGAVVAAGATDELTASIAEINRQLNRTAGSVREAVAKADKTDAEIASLADAAQKVGDVIKLIQHIAGQTNLLALNATIEAARAGVAGRGFGVVAAEVKSLSLQTARATDDITQQIAAVRASATHVINALRTVTNQMQEIDVYSSEAAASVEKQAEATREISNSVGSAAKGAQTMLCVLSEVASDATTTSESARAVLQTSASLEAAATNLRTEVDSFLEKVAEKDGASPTPIVRLTG